MATNQQSTRQLLEKIPNFQCLYRHSANGTYYAIKKFAGKRKEHSLQTTDRKIAERKLADWIKSLDKLDTEQEKTTLAQLIDKFVAARQGKAAKTIATDASIVKRFKEQWKNGLDIRVSSIRPSQLDEWLATNENRLKHSSYNRYCGLLKELFEIAVSDRMVVESPFEKVKTRWKRPQKPQRFVPTQEQFRAIVNDIRAQRYNAEADDSANFIEFIGLAGLGQAETSGLKWGDVDWKDTSEGTNGVLRIRRKKTQETFKVPLFEWLKPFMENLYKQYSEPPKPDTRIFNISDARKALASACSRLKLYQFTQRSIRAALILRLWRGGVDKKLIAKWQGHQDGGKLLMDTYTEVFGADDSEYIKTELAKVR
jgi:integrase